MRVKLIFTFLVLVAYVSLGHAQTKEETIAWIKEKLEKYPCQDGDEVIKIDECEIVIKHYLIAADKTRWYEITMPTNPESYGDSGLYFKSKVIKSVYSGTNEIKYKDNYPCFMEFSREDDLGERFLKPCYI